MGFGEVPIVVDDNAKPAAEVRVAEKDLFGEIFGVSPKAPEAHPDVSITDLGRIQQMSMPPAWVAGPESNIGTSYSKIFNPNEKGPDGALKQRSDVSIELSYRGNRLSDAASKAFRALIDSAPADGSARLLTPKELQSPPLNEVLGDRGSKDTFNLVSAKVQRVNGEPALIIEGKYAKHEINARAMFIDAERENRTARGAPVQEMAFIAPTKEFFKFAPAASDALNKIHWKR